MSPNVRYAVVTKPVCFFQCFLRILWAVPDDRQGHVNEPLQLRPLHLPRHIRPARVRSLVRDRRYSHDRHDHHQLIRSHVPLGHLAQRYLSRQPCHGEWGIFDYRLFSANPGIIGTAHYLTHYHSERPKPAWLFYIYFYLQKHFPENIWKRNVNQKQTTNSPSNILLTFALYSSYFQKYKTSRRYFPKYLWVWIG